MGFYDLSKQDRVKVTEKINRDIINDLNNNSLTKIQSYFSNDDTYIRKLGYSLIGKIDFTHESLQQKIISMLKILLQQDDFRIRQTAINTAGEIGRFEFQYILSYL